MEKEKTYWLFSLQLLYNSLKISWENLVLAQSNNFYLTSLGFLICFLLDNV